jgi:predicted thioesterase
MAPVEDPVDHEEHRPTARLEFEVTAADTAVAWASGDLDVLATPRLVAWLEAATCEAVADRLEPGQTTVGTSVEFDHLAPSPVGAWVLVSAELAGATERTLLFNVEAKDRSSGQVLGGGVITRAVVDRQRFLARLARS